MVIAEVECICGRKITIENPLQEEDLEGWATVYICKDCGHMFQLLYFGEWYRLDVYDEEWKPEE